MPLAPLGLALLIATVPPLPDPEPAPSVAGLIRESAARYQVDAGYLERLLICESGLRPEATGALGEIGPAQLHPAGLLRDFFARGYSNPRSLAESVDYTAWALSQGMDRHWLVCSQRARR